MGRPARRASARTTSGGPMTFTSTCRGVTTALGTPTTSTVRLGKRASAHAARDGDGDRGAARADVADAVGRRVDGDAVAGRRALRQAGHVERRRAARTASLPPGPPVRVTVISFGSTSGSPLTTKPSAGLPVIAALKRDLARDDVLPFEVDVRGVDDRDLYVRGQAEHARLEHRCCPACRRAGRSRREQCRSGSG